MKAIRRKALELLMSHLDTDEYCKEHHNRPSENADVCFGCAVLAVESALMDTTFIGKKFK